MGNVGRKSLDECPSMVLDPSFDFVVLVGREVIRVTEDHLAECLVLTHVDSGLSVKSEVEMVVDNCKRGRQSYE